MRAGWVIAVALLVAARPAIADDKPDKTSYHAVIDRVDYERAVVGGTRLRIYLSALSLQGQVIDLSDPKTLKLYVGGSEKKAPYSYGAYSGTTGDTAMVIVVQASQDYSTALRAIAEALDSNVLAAMPDRDQIAILTYGDNIGNAKLGSAKSARSQLGALASDGSAGEPALLDTLDRALGVLKKAKAKVEGRPLRKMIVVIGDGRDRSSDRERVTRLGKRALKENVRIHSFAFSPADTRRPMLALGELSKQSLGTFRWVRGTGAESWVPAFQQLHDEIVKQYVITYFLSPDDDVADQKIHIQTVGRIETVSNDYKVSALACSGETCEVGAYCGGDHCQVPASEPSRGILGWILLLGLIGIGAMLVLGLIGFLLTRRQQRAARPPVPVPLPGQPPVPGVSSPPPVQAPQNLPPAFVSGASLLVMSGPRSGQRFPLRHGFTIGKDATCDLVIDDGYTSSHHAMVAVDASGNFLLYDRGSTNGTYVNGAREVMAMLSHGMALRIGSTEIRFLAQ